MIEHSDIVLTLAMRFGWPANDPSPKKAPPGRPARKWSGSLGSL